MGLVCGTSLVVSIVAARQYIIRTRAAQAVISLMTVCCIIFCNPVSLLLDPSYRENILYPRLLVTCYEKLNVMLTTNISEQP